MNVAVVYTAVTGGPLTSDLASRFIATWHEHPPGAPCDLWVACNGGPLLSEQVLMFAALNAQMFPRVNDAGKDLTGYIDAARGPCAGYEMVLFCGETVFFHREGWLKRLVDVATRYGPGMYGPWGSNVVRAHLQTTAFFCDPKLLTRYPMAITNHEARMQMEHGENSFWRWVERQGRPVRLVTFDGDYEPRMWRYPQNIIWRGDQSNCIMWCNHCTAWFETTPANRHAWSMNCDQPFK